VIPNPDPFAGTNIGKTTTKSEEQAAKIGYATKIAEEGEDPGSKAEPGGTRGKIKNRTLKTEGCGTQGRKKDGHGPPAVAKHAVSLREKAAATTHR
jgi:hypothetical protein